MTRVIEKQELEKCLERWDMEMESSYSKWREHNDWYYEDFISSLDPIARKCVLLGNFNYQVENGGFSQWVDNGYGLYYKEVQKILKEIGTNESILVSNMIDSFSKYINTRKKASGYDNYWTIDDVGMDICSELDDKYYEVNKKLLDDIAMFLYGKKE